MAVVRPTREAAKLVYRALRAAGAPGLARSDLEQMTGLTSSGVLDTITWMRTHGVDVRFARASLAGDPNRFVLGELLPAAFDELV